MQLAPYWLSRALWPCTCRSRLLWNSDTCHSKGTLSETIEDGITGCVVEDFAEGFFKLPVCFGLDRCHVALRTRERFNYVKMSEQYVQTYIRIMSTTSPD